MKTFTLHHKSVIVNRVHFETDELETMRSHVKKLFNPTIWMVHENVNGETVAEMRVDKFLQQKNITTLILFLYR